MAANFWKSTHARKWIKSKQEVSLLRAKFARDEDLSQPYTGEELRKLRISFVLDIQSLGKTLRLRQRVIATACVYFQRLYLGNSFFYYDPNLFAFVCLFVAMKVEECHLRVHSFYQHLTAYYSHAHRAHYPYTTKDIVRCEVHLVQDLEFSLLVYHAYRPLTQYCEDVVMSRELLETAWYLVNDSLRTDLCLLYPPYLIALGCLYMASVYLKTDCEAWFERLNVDMGEVLDIAAELVALYELTQSMQDNTSASDLRTALNKRLLRHFRPPRCDFGHEHHRRHRNQG